MKSIRNFICRLPYHLKGNSTFRRLIGEKSNDLALKLLNDALTSPEYNDDSEVKAEIEERIAYLSLKPIATANCKSCGKFFRYKIRGYRRVSVTSEKEHIKHVTLAVNLNERKPIVVA